MAKIISGEPPLISQYLKDKYPEIDYIQVESTDKTVTILFKDGFRVITTMDASSLDTFQSTLEFANKMHQEELERKQ